jgi:hypothetical protein
VFDLCCCKDDATVRRREGKERRLIGSEEDEEEARPWGREGQGGRKRGGKGGRERGTEGGREGREGIIGSAHVFFQNKAIGNDEEFSWRADFQHKSR